MFHRRNAVIRISKILYPTDFSSHSDQAYFHAVALAEKHGANLTIAFVYSPSFFGTAKAPGRRCRAGIGLEPIHRKSRPPGPGSVRDFSGNRRPPATPIWPR